VIVAYLYKSGTGRRRIPEDRNTGNCLRCCDTERLCRRGTANIRPRRDIRRHTHRPCTLPDIHSGVRPESLCTENRDRKRSADYTRLRPHTVYGKRKNVNTRCYYLDLNNCRRVIFSRTTASYIIRKSRVE